MWKWKVNVASTPPVPVTAPKSLATVPPGTPATSVEASVESGVVASVDRYCMLSGSVSERIRSVTG